MTETDTFEATGDVQTWDVSERLIGEVDVTIDGASGQDGSGGSGSSDGSSGGDAGTGGRVEATFESGWLIDHFAALDFYVADGTWGRDDGGAGGDASLNGGDGGDGAGSSEVVGDDGTTLGAADGGGGGGGGGAANGIDNNDDGGGGGGGGGRGGDGGSGGSADRSGSSGDDAEGTGDGGDGGDGGDAVSLEADDGTDGTDGGGEYHTEALTGSVTPGGGRLEHTGEIALEYELADRPTDLEAVGGADSITLTWTDPDWSPEGSVDEIEVYRDTSADVSTDGTPFATVSPGTEEYVDTDVVESWTFYYAIVAVGGSTRSPYDGEVDATVALPPPSDVTVTEIRATEADLEWTINSTDEDRVLVESSLDGSAWDLEQELGPGTESTTLEDLLNGRDYQFRVGVEVDEP